MARTDVHLDAMLRHLGAAYYESLHGRADRADVTRALDTVEEHLNEHSANRPAGEHAVRRAPRVPAQGHGDDEQQPHHHRYARRVRDVMTTEVITVDRITPYKEIARLLTEHRISGVPVLMMGRHVAGVVTEADLLAVEDKPARQHRAATAAGQRRWLRPRRHAPDALVAGDLMTSPPITIHPDATIPGAARVMNANHIRRLPVIDEDGKLMGLVSRRDLLSVFLRPDSAIEEDARAVLEEILPTAPDATKVFVRNGVVTLTGALEPAAGRHGDLVPVAIRLLWNVDGVVDVVNHLGERAAAS